MPLLAIRNQAISMEPIVEQAYSVCDPTPFCQVFKTGDIMRVQMRQTPCDDNLICNPNFSLGANMASNGTFTGSATGWTLGTGWAYSSGQVEHSGGPGGGTISQDIPAFVTGNTYYVTFTILEINNALSISIGGNPYGSVFSDAGTYTIPIVCGASNTLLEFTGAYIIKLDDIFVGELDCWEYTSTWSINSVSGTACHIPGSSGYLRETIYSSVSAGDYVSVTYSIFGMSAGQVEVYVGGTLARTVTENGTYTDYVTTAASDDYLKFSVDADFDGCVQSSESYLLMNLSTLGGVAQLQDQLGNVVAAASVELIEDRVNIYVDTAGLSNSCYYMQVTDPCEVDGVALGLTEINADVPCTNSGVWTEHASAPSEIHVDAGGSDEIIAYTAGALLNNVQFVSQAYSFSPGTFLIKVEFTIGTQWQGSFGSRLALVLPTGATATAYYLTSATVGPNPGDHFICYITATINNPSTSLYQSVNMHDQFGIAFINTATGAEDVNNGITNISVKIQVVDGTESYFKTSNCLSVQSETEALLMVGESDSDYSHGFVFSTQFPRLERRQHLSFTNPHHSIKTGSYLFSSGEKKKNYSQNDKAWDLVFHAVDENAHDNIQTIISMDHLKIYRSTSEYSEYIAEDKSYDPEWPKKGNTGLAESQVEVTRISGVTYK